MCPHALCFILDTYSVPTFNNVYCTLTFLRPKVPVLWSPTLDTSNARIFKYLLCCLHKLEEYESLFNITFHSTDYIYITFSVTFETNK